MLEKTIVRTIQVLVILSIILFIAGLFIETDEKPLEEKEKTQTPVKPEPEFINNPNAKM